MKRIGLGAAVLIAALVAAALMFARPPAESPQPASAPADAGAVVATPAATASVPVIPSVTISPPASEGCPAGMLPVRAIYCPFVAHRCEAWLSAVGGESARRCERFFDDVICEGRPSRLSFCIDRYEYPNQEGMLPAVMVSYHEAKRACAIEGKRLCEAEEWRLACEGQRIRPYPTGIERDPSACNIDRRPRTPKPAALAQPHNVSLEIERLDQRVPAGAVPCTSPFGVADMTGNVAEWVHDREGSAHVAPRVTALAGGHYERDAATCRQLDGSHGGSFVSHRAGFRCCADARDGSSPRQLMPSGFRLPRRRAIMAAAGADGDGDG